MEPKKNKTSNKQTALKQNINSHILKHATYHIRSNNSSTVSSAAENLPLEHLWSITEERENTCSTSCTKKIEWKSFVIVFSAYNEIRIGLRCELCTQKQMQMNARDGV